MVAMSDRWVTTALIGVVAMTLQQAQTNIRQDDWQRKVDDLAGEVAEARREQERQKARLDYLERDGGSD